MRIDKWLWAARFYKTRRLAVDEINKGRVRIGGNVVKPARIVSVGDIITLNKAQTQFEVKVVKLIETRGPAKIAETMYTESQASIEQRQREKELRKLSQVARPIRPDRREKRKLRDMRQGVYND